MQPSDPRASTSERHSPPAAIAHGGVGSPPERSDGCRRAVDAALLILESGGEPIDAAVAGVIVLEDDPRFNAGTGSRVRIDGETVQMDASLMDSSGRFSAVAIIERVRNPILVARAVRNTPHLVLAGDGATRFARTMGFPDYDPATSEAKAETAELIERLRRVDPTLPEGWANLDVLRLWNYERSATAAGLGPDVLGADTVGVAVRGHDGRFAVALSTGGTALTLRGRVGDVPIIGAGLWAGPHGAAAATGTGERIIERLSGRSAHEALAAGATPLQAAQQAVAAIASRGSIGMIVMGSDAMAAAADREMAWAARTLGHSDWLGPEPA